jgi:hypothetical protein
MPIYDIRGLWRRGSLGILRSEALLKRGDHLGEPVYPQSFSCSTGHSFQRSGNKRKMISPEHVQPVKGEISTNVTRENGTREPVAHLE